ncbi:TonB-dependent siderophore receptor [Gemmobacter serpentinus]|uniref:TonB-dependent siderophore receptor n=1 Tax=Gemmobacter serpentinus TaxID=2652247 RepID=UPI001CF6C071|nr:TonB-dependent siderophore receptor [Gemmobacter serpentinus]
MRRQRTETTGNDRLRKFGRMGLVAMLGATALPALAQEARYSFDIASKPVTRAVNDLGRTAGLSIIILGDSAVSVSANRVSGNLSVDEALSTLLSGTGLAWRYANASTVQIYKPARGGTDRDGTGVVTLGTVFLDGAGNGATSFVAGQSGTASKTGTPVLEVPQSVSVIGKRQMEAQGARSVTEALRYVPGVNIETYGPDPKGYEWIMLRGFNGQSSSAYLDGLRQMASNYSHFRTDPHQIETVEVLRGPSSTLYGQSDAGGIVGKTSKKPVTETLRNLELSYGSFATAATALDFGGSLTADDVWSYRLVGVARDGNTQFSFGDGTRMKDDRLMLAPSITWAPNADTSLTVSAQTLRDRSGGTAIYFTPTHVLVGDPNFSQSDQKQQTLGYELSHRLDENWVLRQNLRYGRVAFDLDMLAMAGADATGIMRQARRFSEEMDSLGLDTNLQGEFSTGSVAHKLVAGLDVSRSDTDARRWNGDAPSLNPYAPTYGVSVPVPTALAYDYTEKFRQTGLYLQDEIRADKFLFTIGGRYDWLRITNDNHMTGLSSATDVNNFSGRAGISYITDFGLVPYLSYAESFMPNTGIGSNGLGFAPTKGRQWELGAKYQPANTDAMLTMALFDITKSNVLTPELNAGGGGTGFNVATGEIRSRGFEIEGKASLGSGWDIAANYTYNDVEITRDNAGNQGNRPALVAKTQASLWLNYAFTGGAMDGLSIGGGLRHVGGSFGDSANTVPVDGRTVIDLGLGYDLNESTKLAVNVTNLTDKEYSTTCASAMSCYEGDRRQVTAKLALRF